MRIPCRTLSSEELQDIHSVVVLLGLSFFGYIWGFTGPAEAPHGRSRPHTGAKHGAGLGRGERPWRRRHGMARPSTAGFEEEWERRVRMSRRSFLS